MRQKAMAAGKIHNPAAPVSSADPPRHLPSLVELFSWKRSGTANGPCNFIEKAVARKQRLLPICQPVF